MDVYENFITWEELAAKQKAVLEKEEAFKKDVLATLDALKNDNQVREIQLVRVEEALRLLNKILDQIMVDLAALRGTHYQEDLRRTP